MSGSKEDHKDDPKIKSELPLTPERIARVITGNDKTFKGNGQEVRK